MSLKSFHLFSSVRMRGFCNVVYSLLSKGIEKGYSQYGILIYVCKEVLMHPFAMKGLQKMCVFLSKWYKCVLEGNG